MSDLEISHCDRAVTARKQTSVVHVQNLCFAYQTHCFFDILIAITVVGAKAPS